MTMVTIVLAGLVFVICENFLDDVITWGKDEDELITRLRLLFDRYKKHGLYLNPEKCRFGVPEIEYLGHTMNEHGLSFSKEKVEKVLDFPLPKTGRDLKSFIGVVGYLRDNIQDHTSVMKPLLDLARRYDKSEVIEWNDEAIWAFDAIRQRVNDMQTVFFVDEDSPVFLETDASDYGIGAHCYQKIDGKNRPIAFMSKALSAQECNWSTIEKECYAIVAALRKFEYLLRDRSFTLASYRWGYIVVQKEISNFSSPEILKTNQGLPGSIGGDVYRSFVAVKKGASKTWSAD